MAQWSEINDGLNRGNVNALFSKDQEWVISTKSGGFYKSIDLGASWKISNTKSLSWIIPNIINSNDTLFYVDNFPNLNISTDFSNSWVIKTIPFQSDNPYYLAYFYKNIYLSLKSHLLISNDLGNSWIDKTNSNISSPFFIEKIDSNILLANRNSIYLCDKNLNNCNPIYLNSLSYISFLKVFDNDIYTSSSGNLIKSSNYGVDWDTIVKSKFGINRFFKSENLIVLVTDSLLISIDNGNNWINLPPLYPKHIINSIKKLIIIFTFQLKVDYFNLN
jgi:hypothetical protein